MLINKYKQAFSGPRIFIETVLVSLLKWGFCVCRNHREVSSDPTKWNHLTESLNSITIHKTYTLSLQVACVKKTCLCVKLQTFWLLAASLFVKQTC